MLPGPRIAAPIALALVAAVLALAGCGGGSETTATESSAPFAPNATLRAVGGTKRADKPAIELRVSTRPGDDEIRSVFFNLPPAFLVDPEALKGFCTERRLKSDDCAGSRQMGTAKAVSPAYGGALTGPVFAVTGSGGLPKLAYLLHGPPDILLRGKIVSKGGRIGAGVEDIPDVPIKSFELDVDGGKDGYLLVSRDLCGPHLLADAEFESQTGATFRHRVPLEAACS